MEVKGYPNYTVDDKGNIHNKHNRKMTSFKVNGYHIICLYKDNTKQNKKVHKIVAEAFLNSVPTDIIDHKNRNKDDNRLKNLRVVSCVENRHNINQLSNNESGYTGIYIKNEKYLSTITINYKEYKKIIPFSEDAIQRALHFRLTKKIENGILV